MTGGGLQLLLVEDSADDFKLLQLELERHGYAPVLQRVATKGDFLEALRDRSWDAIISDLNQVRTLTGLLPICSSCKCIRDDRGYWQELETYLSSHSQAVFSPGICPQCAEEFASQSEVKVDRHHVKRQRLLIRVEK
jgi:hypothetical protein